MAETTPAPLLAVSAVFRSRPNLLGLSHALHDVSTFLDTSVELSLRAASKFGSIKLLDRIWDSSQVYAGNEGKDPENLWTLRTYIRKDKHYRQFQFRLSMSEAASRKDMEMLKWLSSKFPECKIPSEVVVKTCEQGAMEILQFFYDNDCRVMKSKGLDGVGHAVEWGGGSMAAAISAHRSDIAWWLHRHIPDAEFDMKAAVASALKTGDIMAMRWLISNGAEFPSHLNGDICFEEVAALGRLDMLQWLDEEGKLSIEGAVYLLGTAAENEHLEVVRWLVENDEDGQLTKLGGEGSVAIHPAAVNGHLDVAKYLRAKVQRRFSTLERKHELREQNNFYYRALNGHPWSKADKVSWRTMSEAAKNGHFDVVQWLYAEYGDDPFVDLFEFHMSDILRLVAMDAAANTGHLDILKYLHELETVINAQPKKRKRESTVRISPPTCTEAAMNGAAANGHLAVVKWLHENQSEGCTTGAMDGAASGGHLEVVQWLFKNRSEGCTTEAMDGAAEYGHVEVVQWLHSNTQDGCTTLAMDGAAQNGHLEVVKWLHEHRSEGCTTDAMDNAAKNGFLKVVKWLHANRKEGCTAQIANTAASCDRLNILQWLRSHGFKDFPITCIQSAAISGHFEMLLYLHSQCHLEFTENFLSRASSWSLSEMMDWVCEKYQVFRAGNQE